MFNRKSLISMTLAAALMVSGVNAFAMSQHDAHEKAEKLKKELNLTDDQVKKIESIYTESHKEREKLHESTKEQVKGVLTPEQQKKFDEMKENHKATKASKTKAAS
jgi:Spy/CpxP family protein refolding chaperone